MVSPHWLTVLLRRQVHWQSERCSHRYWIIWIWRESVVSRSNPRPYVLYIRQVTGRNIFLTWSIHLGMSISTMRFPEALQPVTVQSLLWMQHRESKRRHWQTYIWRWIMIWMFFLLSTRLTFRVRNRIEWSMRLRMWLELRLMMHRGFLPRQDWILKRFWNRSSRRSLHRTVMWMHRSRHWSLILFMMHIRVLSYSAVYWMDV